MPTSTFTVAANADDGMAPLGTAVYTNQNFNSVSSVGPSACWVRFTGITIPQGSTINSATMKPYLTGGPTRKWIFKVDSRQSPGNPTNATQVRSPANIQGTVSVSPTNYATGGSKANYLLSNVDVTAIVQALVNAYDYSSGEMVVYGFMGGSAPPSFMYMYAKDWGATKAPTLVVDYTAGADNSSSSSSESTSSQSSDSSSSQSPVLEPKTQFKFT